MFGEGFVAVQRTARSFVRVVSVAALVAGLMFLVAPSLHVPSLSGVWAFDLAFIACAMALIAWLAAKRLRRGSVLMVFAAPAANLPPRARSCASRMSLDEVVAVEVCSSLRRLRSEGNEEAMSEMETAQIYVRVKRPGPPILVYSRLWGFRRGVAETAGELGQFMGVPVLDLHGAGR